MKYKSRKIVEDYVAVIRDEDSIRVCFYVDRDKVMAIGEKMNEIREEAYMRGGFIPVCP